jgi:hypothetical protein
LLLINIPQQRVDWQAYDAFEGTDAAVARSIGLSPNNCAQYKCRRLRHERCAAGKGNLPAISPHGIPGVPHFTGGTLPPTTKPSVVIALDLWEAIQAFAASHHLRVKDALDLLIRKGLAAHGEGVRAGA